MPVPYEAELREIAGRYPQARSGLLPMLHLVQSQDGMITPAGIEACAEVLGITAAEVSGVATFYTMYKRRPVGDYHVGVCTNTLCAVMGGDEIFAALKEHLEVGNDETAAKREGDRATVSLEHIECNAACDYAPVMTVNWEFMDNQTPASARQLVDDLRAGKEVSSTRGPTLCTWRQAERVLAGFDDGLTDAGPAAGPASLVGLQIARERGWSAPGLDTPGSSLAGHSTTEGAPGSSLAGHSTTEGAPGSSLAGHSTTEGAHGSSLAGHSTTEGAATGEGDD
nr:NADH-quinone oxidoreductase subunit NuoE [Nocardioides sp. DJM-14]